MNTTPMAERLSPSQAEHTQSRPTASLESSFSERLPAVAVFFTRWALATAFLSAVADRFGLWGASGAPGVAWGDFQSFQSYTSEVLSFLPAALAPPLGIVATGLEVLLAAALLLGFKTRWTALASGLLLSSFALSMMISFGIKAPLDYSVMSAAGAAFLLAAFSD